MNNEIIFRTMALLLMIAAALRDFRSKNIDIHYPLIGGALSLIYICIQFHGDFRELGTMLFSAIPGLLMLFMSYFTREGIGPGDGLMAVAIAPILGFPGIAVAIMISFMLSAVICMILLLLKKVTVKTTLPFLPFLTCGVGVVCYAL